MTMRLGLRAGPANQSADLDFRRRAGAGEIAALAGIARGVLKQGHRKSPQQARFLVELAGVDYKLKDMRAAKRELHAALKIRAER